MRSVTRCSGRRSPLLPLSPLPSLGTQQRIPTLLKHTLYFRQRQRNVIGQNYSKYSEKVDIYMT